MKTRGNFIRYLFTSLYLMTFLILTPTLTAKASEFGVDINLSSDDVPSTTSTFAEGISPGVKSGYLIYIVDNSGNPISPDARLIMTTSSYTFPARGTANTMWSVTSRLGGYTATSVSRGYTAEWGAPLTISGGWNSNEATIRAWMSAPDASGAPNAAKLISDFWGNSLAQDWGTNNYNLVLEPVFSFRAWYKYECNVIYRGAEYPATYNSRTGSPVMVGTTKGLANMMSSFLGSLSSMNSTRTIAGAGVTVEYTYATGFTSSAMSSGYARGFCHAEKLSRSIGSLPAGGGGNSTLSLSQINSAGYGILAISAHDSGTLPPVTPTPSPHSYEGYLYTLSCTGMNGSSSSNATFQGTFYAESSASGDDAYALASSKASGLSYTGSVPSVIFTGTNYDMGLTSKASVRTGCVTLDAGTFYGVSGINTVTESDYQSFAGSVTGSITRGIDLKTYNGSSLKATYPYDDSSWESSGFTGGSYTSTTRNLTKYATLTQSNSARSGSAPDWKDEYNFKLLMLDISKMYYNKNVGSESEGLGIWSASDLARAFNDSTDAYLSAVKSNGTLQTYWTNAMNADRDSKSNKAGDDARRSALAEYDRLNPEPPTAGSEPVRDASMTRAEFNALHSEWEATADAYSAWDAARTVAGDDAYRSAHDSTYSAYNESAFTVNWNSGSQGDQTWRVNVYSQNPYYESGYMIYDKVPIRSGPSATAGRLFQNAYAAKFFYTMQTSGVYDTSHLITFIPFAGNVTTTIGSCGSVDYLVDNAHIVNSDFLIPDATSADMK